MSTVARTLTLFNNFSVTYPSEPSVLLSYTGGWQAELRLPPWLLKTAFCVGSFWLASMATRFLFRSKAGIGRIVENFSYAEPSFE